MAPARSSTRRSAQVPPSGQQHAQDDDLVANKELFIDPMLGTALAIYIEKDVEDKDNISQLIVVSHFEAVVMFMFRILVGRALSLYFLNVLCPCILIWFSETWGHCCSRIQRRFIYSWLVLLCHIVFNDIDYPSRLS